METDILNVLLNIIALIGIFGVAAYVILRHTKQKKRAISSAKSMHGRIVVPTSAEKNDPEAVKRIVERLYVFGADHDIKVYIDKSEYTGATSITWEFTE